MSFKLSSGGVSISNHIRNLINVQVKLGAAACKDIRTKWTEMTKGTRFSIHELFINSMTSKYVECFDSLFCWCFNRANMMSGDSFYCAYLTLCPVHTSSSSSGHPQKIHQNTSCHSCQLSQCTYSCQRWLCARKEGERLWRRLVVCVCSRKSWNVVRRADSQPLFINNFHWWWDSTTPPLTAALFAHCPKLRGTMPPKKVQNVC